MSLIIDDDRGRTYTDGHEDRYPVCNAADCPSCPFRSEHCGWEQLLDSEGEEAEIERREAQGQ